MAAAANPAWCGMRRRCRGTARGRSRCRGWRPARAACTHSPSSTMTFILVADLRWKVGARGEVSERGWRRMLRQGNAHRGRAARQLSAPQPGKQTLPTGNHFCARHGGGQSQGLCRAAKAEGVLRPEPMAGASDARPLFAQTAVHRSMPGGCIEQMPNKTCSRGTRGLSDVGSARGACAAAAALRGHARVVQARVRRGVPPQAGAHSPPEKSLLRNFLTEELGVGSNAGGRVIAQELRNKSQSCWFGNLQGQPESHQPFTSFKPDTAPFFLCCLYSVCGAPYT